MVKKITWDKIPTNILAVVVAMAVTLVAFFAACQIMGWAVTWYMVAGAVALGAVYKRQPPAHGQTPCWRPCRRTSGPL